MSWWQMVGLIIGSLLASSVVWFFVHNRWLAWMEDGVYKYTIWALSVVVCVVMPWVSWLVGGGVLWGVLICVVVLVMLLLRIRYACLRACYHHQSATKQDDCVLRCLTQPWVTTTHLRVARYRLPCLHPALAGLRIGHVSDLHLEFHPPLEFYQQAFDLLAQESPHLILITGDCASRNKYLPALGELLAHLHACLGVYAIKGNHEWWLERDAVHQQFDQSLVVMLDDRSVTIRGPAGLPVCLVGCEHPWSGLQSGFNHIPTNLASDTAMIVLTHLPDNIYTLTRFKPHLVLAGHNHAGQIRLPWIGALAVPSAYDMLFDQGHFQVEKTHLIVSAGLGAGFPHLRLFCRPEVGLIDFE